MEHNVKEKRCGFSIQLEKEERQNQLIEYTKRLEYFKKDRTDIQNIIDLENEKTTPNQSLIDKNKEILHAIDKEISALEHMLESLKNN